MRHVVVRIFFFHSVEFGLSYWLVRDHVELELLQLVFVPKDDLPLSFALVQFVTFDSLLEILYLGYDISTMVSYLNKASKQSVPKVLVLNPPRKILTF